MSNLPIIMSISPNRNFAIRFSTCLASFAVLSSLCLHAQVKSEPFRYTNPFVPIYAEGDDTSRAVVKPSVIYKEVPGSRIEIPNMPAIKTQSELGECRAFSLGVILQKMVCDEMEYDCKNIPAKREISYFGLAAYTQVDLKEDFTFIPNQGEARSFYELIDSFKQKGAKFILESCLNSNVLVKNFSRSGQAGIDKFTAFMAYLKLTYDTKKGLDATKIADCEACVEKINKEAGIYLDQVRLKKALTRDSFDKFMYVLFFGGCEMKNFPSAFSVAAYPVDSKDATPDEIKRKVIEGLKENKPVLFPNLCITQDVGYKCGTGHSLVVSGYRHVAHPKKKDLTKELFKVHNSWGEEWQHFNNSGWVDADEITRNTVRVKSKDPDSYGKYKLPSSSVMWLKY